MKYEESTTNDQQKNSKYAQTTHITTTWLITYNNIGIREWWNLSLNAAKHIFKSWNVAHYFVVCNSFIHPLFEARKTLAQIPYSLFIKCFLQCSVLYNVWRTCISFQYAHTNTNIRYLIYPMPVCVFSIRNDVFMSLCFSVCHRLIDFSLSLNNNSDELYHSIHPAVAETVNIQHSTDTKVNPKRTVNSEHLKFVFYKNLQLVFLKTIVHLQLKTIINFGYHLFIGQTN